MFTPEKILPILKPVMKAPYYHTSANPDVKGMLKITRTQYEELRKLYLQAEQYAQK